MKQKCTKLSIIIWMKHLVEKTLMITNLTKCCLDICLKVNCFSNYWNINIARVLSDNFGGSVITNSQLPECKMFSIETYLSQFTDISHSDNKST